MTTNRLVQTGGCLGAAVTGRGLKQRVLEDSTVSIDQRKYERAGFHLPLDVACILFVLISFTLVLASNVSF